jgi:hypothetical protein
MGEEARLITFEEALQIAGREIRSQYPSIAGITIFDYGVENADSYQIFMQISDPDYLNPEDGPGHVVNKVTGEYSQIWGNPCVIPDATNCGAPLPDYDYED